MTTFVEDYSTWTLEALTQVPPESLEAADLMALVIELQNRIQDSIWQWPIQLKD